MFAGGNMRVKNLMFDRYRTRELMGIFADKFADKIKESLTDFYQKQMEIKK
jgi:hypothetical protein